MVVQLRSKQRYNNVILLQYVVVVYNIIICTIPYGAGKIIIIQLCSYILFIRTTSQNNIGYNDVY